MKIIDLLNKIANDIDVPPKQIKYDNKIFEYKLWLEPNKYAYVEKGKNNTLEEYCCFYDLNDEAEIIEEEPKPLTKQDVEALGYACGEIRKCFENGWNKSLENKYFEEDKKIEKIDVIPYEKCIHEVTHKEKEILLEIRDIQMKFNKIIDYLMENKQ